MTRRQSLVWLARTSMTSGPKRSLRPLRAALDVLTGRNDFAHHRGATRQLRDPDVRDEDEDDFDEDDSW